jgi:hypothetical protein
MWQHVRSWRKRTLREGQRIAALDAEIEALLRQAVALGAEPSADVPLLGVKIAARRERALRKACLWGGAPVHDVFQEAASERGENVVSVMCDGT